MNSALAMASSPSQEQQLQQPASPEKLGTPDKNLPAPAGWQKKIASLKSGGTPKRGAVYFIAPDGEEIKSKRSLEGYLKSHPGGPSVTEFDWSTGETPRRSSRLIIKTKSPLDTPESGSGRKRPRRKAPAEEEAPQNEGRADLEDVPPAKPDEVMEEVEKGEESKTVENVESVEKIEESKAVETIESVGKNVEFETADKVDSVEEIEEFKTVEKGEGSKIVDKTQEFKAVESVIVALLEENIEGKEVVAVPQKENGPEELAEVAPLGEQRKPERMQITVEEKPAGELSGVTQKGCEATDSEKNASLVQEHKEQDSSEKTANGFPQFSEASDASRPVRISV